MSDNIDCGDCPNITDGCRDLCEKIDLGVSRWSANWHMQEFYQSKHGGYVRAADFAVAQSQLAALREELAKYKGGCVDLSSQVRELEHKMDYWEGSNKDLKQRLADAERRNEELSGLLTAGVGLLEAICPDDADWFSDVRAALNPNPEAANQ